MIRRLLVDPGELRVPMIYAGGPNPTKATRQRAQFGTDFTGMPLIEVTRCKGGMFFINNGVTRACRFFRVFPGQMLEVVVFDDKPKYDVSKHPRVKEIAK